MLPNESSAARRLSDLRARPADATLQNLLATLSAKLDLCGRLPIYEYEADREGHDATAATFHGLLEAERRSFEELVTRAPAAPGGHDGPRHRQRPDVQRYGGNRSMSDLNPDRSPRCGS